ncbi:NUDIX domain-containing protein [Streptomyces sp. NPDC017435]|uniref:NUDIX domain-containing protein n=1 Tax=Streptomyces sp. NPDC017435 TaxID=3364995 RepID=UPI00378FD48B
MEAAEPLDRAAQREAEEETGVHISADQQEFGGLVHYHDPGSADRITSVSVTQSWTGEPYNAEPDKHEGLFWVPMEQPPPDCHPYTLAVFRMLTHGPSYTAVDRAGKVPGGPGRRRRRRRCRPPTASESTIAAVRARLQAYTADKSPFELI